MLQTIANIIITTGSIFGICCVILYSFYIFYTIISIVSKPKKAPPAKNINEYGYIICARNESKVIADLIKSILNQNYPSDKMHVFVIADNCSDNTADIAREAGATTVYERFNKELVGKGYALQTIFENLKTNQYAQKCKGFFVFDADNILHPNFTPEMNNLIDNGARIAVGCRNTKNWGDSWIAACNGFSFIRESCQVNRPRSVIGSECVIAGTGWYVEKSLIDAENGWSYTTISEDAEFCVAQILKGEHIYYCEDAEFYDEQVTTWSQSWKQRCRWIKGATLVIGKYGRELFKGIFSKKFVTCFDVFWMYFAGAFISPFGFIISVLSLIASIILFAHSPIVWFIPIGFVFSLYMSFLVSVSLPVLFIWKKIPLNKGKKIKYLLTLPIFMLSYMFVAVRVVILRKRVKWDPIIHKASFDMNILKKEENSTQK